MPHAPARSKSFFGSFFSKKELLACLAFLGHILPMSDLDALLKSHGTIFEFDAFVTASCFADGRAAFALGDGSVVIGGAVVAAHEGAVLCLAPHPAGGFVSGGDDGRLLRIDGAVTEISKFGSKWVDHVAVFAGKAPLLAAAVGKTVHLFSAPGEKLRELAHPSTVTGIAFDAKGKRLAASHYNGA